MYAATAKQFLVRGRKVTGCRKRGGLLVVLMTEPTDFEGFCRLCSMLVFFSVQALESASSVLSAQESGVK